MRPALPGGNFGYLDIVNCAIIAEICYFLADIAVEIHFAQVCGAGLLPDAEYEAVFVIVNRVGGLEPAGYSFYFPGFKVVFENIQM